MGLPGVAWASYCALSDGDTTTFLPISQKQVDLGGAFSVYLWLNYEDNALAVNDFAAASRIKWDPSALSLVDTAVVSHGATSVTTSVLNPNIPSSGSHLLIMDYNPNYVSNKVSVIRYDFTKLTAAATTINVVIDSRSIPAELGCLYNDFNNGKLKADTAINLVVYSTDTTPPTIDTPTIGTMIAGETRSVADIILRDASAAVDNMACSIWVHPGTGGSWMPVNLSCDTYYGDTAVFSGSIPGTYITTPYVYYFLSGRDSAGNFAKWPAGANLTDTNNADSKVVYSNVPLTVTGVGRGSTYYSDSLPASVHYATTTDSVYIWVNTAADSVYVLNRSLGAFDDTEVTTSNTNTTTTSHFGCTVPLKPDAANYIVVVGQDGVMPWTTSETIVVYCDTVGPQTPVVSVNNGATAINSLTVNLMMTANDTLSGTLKFYVDACTMPYAPDASLIDATYTKGQNMTGDTGSPLTVTSYSDSNYLYLYVQAEDSAGNKYMDGSNIALKSVIIDTMSPRIYDYANGAVRTYTSVGDSDARTGETQAITLAIADSTAITGTLYFRHQNIGVSTWAADTLVLLGALGGDFNLYGCSIPAHVVGQVGTNDCTGGIEVFAQITDALGQSTWIDSRGVTLNDSYSTVVQRQASGFDTFTAGDSVYIAPQVLTDAMFNRGYAPQAVAWNDTVYVTGNTLYIGFGTNADTVRVIGANSTGGTIDTAVWPNTRNYWTSTDTFSIALPLGPGYNWFSLQGHDDSEPTRMGDTIYVFNDTMVPLVVATVIETGALAVDTQTALVVSVTAYDTRSALVGSQQTTPDTIVLSDTFWMNPSVLADTTTAYLAAFRTYRYAYGAGVYTYNVTRTDTTIYSLYAYAIDQVGNVSTAVTAIDTIYHDTAGAQIDFAGVADNRAATQPVALTLTVNELTGDSAVSEVKLYYSHPYAQGYPNVTWWSDTTAAVYLTANTWRITIPDSFVGGVADTVTGVRYFVRTRDALNHYTYWGVTGGLQANQRANVFSCHDTTSSTGGDALYQSDYYYDTFSVVLAVSTTITIGVSDATDTWSLASGLYFACDTAWINIVSEGDTKSYASYGATNNVITETQTLAGVGTVLMDSIALAMGTNNIFVYVESDTQPDFWMSYAVIADTAVPMLYGDSLTVRVHRDAITGRTTTDSQNGVYINLLAEDTGGSNLAQYRVGEAPGALGAWQNYAAQFLYTFTARDTVPLFLQVKDAAGNLSALLQDTIYVDTQGPAIVHTAIADSRAKNAALAVTAQVDDLSGTAAVTNVFVWFRNLNQYAGTVNGWDSAAMVRTGTSTTFTGTIPDSAIGTAADSGVDYFIEAWDTYVAMGSALNRSYYYGAGSVQTGVTLAQAQANPDSFTTVSGVKLEVWLRDAADALGSDTRAANGLYFMSDTIFVRLIHDADSVLVYANGVQVAACSQPANATNALDTLTVSTFSCTAGLSTLMIVGIDGSQPWDTQVYTVYVDTWAPVLSAGTDTFTMDSDMVASPDTSVTIYLALTDSDAGFNVTGGIAYYELSETITFNDTVATGRQAYTQLRDWNFANTDGDSVLTLYLRYWDVAGNTSPVSARSMYWDTVAPSIVFTAITDSKPTSRAVAVTATCTDLSGTATLNVVTSVSPYATWETWPLSASGPNTFSGAIPDTVVGSSASLTGVRYYLAATDSWGKTAFWVGDGTLYDSFTVSLPVATTVAARDFDTLTYTTLVSYGSGWTPTYYRTDSFTLKVTTNADTLAVYILNNDRAVVWNSETFAVGVGQVNFDTYLFLDTHLLDDTCFIQVVGADNAEPTNIDTYAIYVDTRTPYFTTAALIDGGLYATGDTSVTVTFAAADTYSVAYVIVSEMHPQFMTDTESRKVAYTTSVTYTLTKDTQVATVYVAAFDIAGNMAVSLDQIWLDTFAPFIYYNGVDDSRSISQRVAVQATIADTSGTVPTVVLYYQDSTSTWGSTAMTAQVGGTYLGYIPANIVGSDTTFRPRYVIVATDTFGRTTYWGANGDSSFTSLAAAQAKPDSFSLVAPVPTSVTIKDGNDAAAPAIAYSGQVFNSSTIGLRITTAAETLAIAIRQQGGTDSFVYFGAVYTSYTGESGFTSPVTCTFPVYQQTSSICTYIITVKAADTDVPPTAAFSDEWTIIVDTQAAQYGVARIGSNAAIDTYIGTVSQNVAFIAQDSYAVSTVCFYGDVTTGTSAYTGAAQAVTFTAGEGWKQLFHYYVDGAGNFSQVFGDTFYLDATTGTVTVSPLNLTTATATYTCTGSVVDNRLDTPATVRVRVNGGTDSTLAVVQATGTFEGPLTLVKGFNTIRVTATDSAGNTSYDEITVTYADAVATVASSTVPVTATISDTGSSLLAVNFGTSDSATITITNVSGSDTLTAVIDFKLTGYTVTVERLDTGTITTSLGSSGNLNGITSSNYASLDSFIVKFTATDSQGNLVADNSSTPYDGITLTWNYGPGISAADEASLHIFYFDPSDSRWKQATTVSGLTTTWPDGSTGEKQSLVNDTIGIRVTHLSIWGVFVGGAPLAANLDNVQIFPNPFKPYDGNAATGEPYDGNPNGMTGIRFINLAANTEIKIYTINGELVDEVSMVANQGLAVWDARNKGGDELASGIYLAVLRANGQTVVKKVAIIR